MPDYRNVPIRAADRKFRIRVKFAVPRQGMGNAASDLHRWLDARVGKDRYMVTPAVWDGRLQASAVHMDDPSAVQELVSWLKEQTGEGRS